MTDPMTDQAPIREPGEPDPTPATEGSAEPAGGEQPQPARVDPAGPAAGAHLPPPVEAAPMGAGIRAELAAIFHRGEPGDQAGEEPEAAPIRPPGAGGPPPDDEPEADEPKPTDPAPIRGRDGADATEAAPIRS